MSILICPGSAKTQSFKRWPVSNFLKLVDLFNKLNYESIIVLGKDESELASSFKHNKIIISPSFEELKKLSEKSIICICNDSFLMHFFSFTGLNTLSIYGSLKPLGELSN